MCTIFRPDCDIVAQFLQCLPKEKIDIDFVKFQIWEIAANRFPSSQAIHRWMLGKKVWKI